MGANRLTEQAVLEFGAEMLRAVLGDGFAGTVMLAGGAFKTLIHGRPPRDLDLWAPNDEERIHLVERLRDRGALLVSQSRYSTTLELVGRRVDVPVRADRFCIDVHFERVDIGIAAVAVQLRNGTLKAAVHPLAIECEQRRQVLFMKPLLNWRHCLGCLARARRYADELGWVLPQTEEAYIWDLFDSQDPAMQVGMMDRGRLTALPDADVLACAQRRAKRFV